MRARQQDDATTDLEPTRRDLPWMAALAVLLLVTAAASAYPLFRSFAHVQINVNEGWNAYRAKMADDGVPLYASPPRYTITNYPPISFHLVGLIGRMTGDVVTAGRYLALISEVLIALLIAAIVRRFVRGWQPALYAALSFALWLALFQPDRIGMNDPQLFATVFGLVGLYLYLARQDSARWLCLSSLAFVISVFAKPNLVALPMAVGLHLLFTARWQRFGTWAGAFALASAAAFLLTVVVDGRYFWAHLTAPRPYSINHALSMISRYSTMLQIPIAAALVWSLWNWRDGSRSVLVIALFVAQGIAIVFSGGAGVDGNVFFDSIVMLAMVTGIAASDLASLVQSRPLGGYILIVLLLAPLTGMAATLPGRFAADYSALLALPAEEERFTDAVNALEDRPGPALCHDAVLCFEAGKPLEAETFTLSIQVSTGRIPEQEMLELVASGHFRAIEVAAKNDGLVSPIPTVDAFMETLTQRYRVAVQNGRYAILIDRSF